MSCEIELVSSTVQVDLFNRFDRAVGIACSVIVRSGDWVYREVWDGGDAFSWGDCRRILYRKDCQHILR